MGLELQEGELELVMSKDFFEIRKEEGDMKCSFRNVWKWKLKGLYCFYLFILVVLQILKKKIFKVIQLIKFIQMF